MIQAADGRVILILLADRFFQHVDFDMARQLGKFRRMDAALIHHVQRLRQADGETAGGTESRTRGHIRHRGDINRGLSAQLSQRFAGDLIPDFVEFAHTLGLRIIQAVRLTKQLGVTFHRHVHKLVNGDTEHSAVSSPVEIRQIGTPAEKADTVGRCGNYKHGILVTFFEHNNQVGDAGGEQSPRGRCGAARNAARGMQKGVPTRGQPSVRDAMTSRLSSVPIPETRVRPLEPRPFEQPSRFGHRP